MTAAAPRPFAHACVGALLLAPAVLIIAAGFLLPLVRLAILSVSAPGGPLAAYREGAKLADAGKLQLEIDPLTGAEISGLLQTAYGAPKETVERAAKLAK